MRKLFSLCAVLFMLGIALLSKPAAAIPLCDCDFCSYSPNSWCEDAEWGFRFRCYEYNWNYC